jgi:hypothetical protein
MRTRNKTKVLSVFAICTALLMAAIPALAQKPVPATYTVDMQFVDGQPGLSTDCALEEPLVMTGTSRAGELKLSDTGTVAIRMRAPTVEWYRSHPIAAQGIGFDECHGPSVYDGPEHPFADYVGALWITISETDRTADFLWHFDYYIDGEDLGKKKTRWVQTIRENYTIAASADYDPTTGIVHGWFPVAWYLKQDGTLIHSYTPFIPTDGIEMTFKLSVTEDR